MPRFARRVAEQQTARQPALIDRWIADEERREAERRRGMKMRPAPPDWLIQYGLNRTNVDAVHTGHCWASAKRGRCRPATRQQALDALRQQVPACVHCRPDTALGTLE
ncbi:DUF6233 domain-containing protein [Streptomyces sp. NPDC001851]|uniref:DUF6233 domain-containing protein n=1 Tax=Streptomyces sp. NPDC001851 TaxID=3154529 RepID=UPI00331FEDBF